MSVQKFILPDVDSIEASRLISCSCCEVEEIYLGDLVEEQWFQFWRAIVNGQWREYGPVCPHCLRRYLSNKGPILNANLPADRLRHFSSKLRQATPEEMEEWMTFTVDESSQN